MAETESRQKRAPRHAAARSAAPKGAVPTNVPAANPMLALQRTIGNQAMQRRPRADTLSFRQILGQQQTLGNQTVQRLLGSRAWQAPIAAGEGRSAIPSGQQRRHVANQIAPRLRQGSRAAMQRQSASAATPGLALSAAPLIIQRAKLDTNEMTTLLTSVEGLKDLLGPTNEESARAEADRSCHEDDAEL